MSENIEYERDKLKRELVEVMARCSSEIKGLRGTIERLAPKADAYDNLVVVLGLLPRPSTGMSEDLAWKLDRRIEEIKKEDADAH
jgi:hypothetical protein